MTKNKHKENLDKTRLKLTSFVTFLVGFSQAVLIYVMSSYFKLATGTESVGIFYAVAYTIFLITLLNLHKLVRLWGKSNVFYFSLLAKILVLIFLIFNDPSKLSVLLLMLYMILGNIEWVAMDVIVESFSVDKLSGRIRGLYLTIINAGFLFGPFVAAYILGKMDFYGIFVFSLIFNCFVFVFALICFRNINHKFEQKLKVFDVIKKVVARKNILRIYYISFVLEFFYALMIIYMPIYLRDLGYSWENIGWIFTAMLMPFVLVQYPMGILADKKTGEKEFLIFSIIIMAISTIAIYFIGTGTVFIWVLVLFATRVGAALIEILRDSYFFKKIDATDVDVINFFRTSLPVAYIAATTL
ncbi:MFS transporter, partial [bacterium]|nr:MFS transporter [bacterium]